MGLSQFPPAAGGIPTGNTAARPASPVVGDVFYNGQKSILEIYDGTNWVPCSAPAATPTIAVADVGTNAAYGSAQGAVTITPGTSGGPADSYVISASTGGYSATTSGTTVTITVGNNGSWTFSGQGVNNFGTSVTGTSVTQTLTTVPQAPTIGTATTQGNEVIITWTLGNNGGKNLSSITVTPYLNGTTAQTATTAATTTATSATISGLTQGSAYTFKVKAANANGNSAESSATNSVNIPITFDVTYLVIAGGGGGGAERYGSGGGGAGGYRSSVTGESSGGGASAENKKTVGVGDNYTVTVGAGGASGSNGSDSTFSTITSIGGGKGGGQGTGQSQGGNGGSGGGVRRLATPGTGTTGQGYAGGLGVTWSGTETQSGGGGGAGGVGGVGVAQTTAGTGGIGVSSSITGTATYRAGGGGGGSWSGEGAGGPGGNGGGGSGSSYSPSADDTPGTANTGGGGGGNGQDDTVGKPGGSGIVILRYPDTRTITVGAGLTAGVTNQSVGTNERYTTITAGTGNVSWS